MDLSIVIVSWNTEKYLEKCLASIFANQADLQLEVFVVDNASKDNTIKVVREKFPQVKLIANKTNRGFATANNQALKQANGKYVLLLNPDTQIIDNALKKMVEFIAQNDDVGIAGCQLLNPDKTIQPSVRTFPTKTAIFLLLTKISKLWPNHPALKKYLAADFDYQAAQSVDQVMGAFFLIQKKLIDQIGLLDEKFFIWFEEVDFCKRTKAAGWKIWYTPTANIIHYGSRSFNQALTVKKQLIFFNSAWHYLKKHGGK